MTRFRTSSNGPSGLIVGLTIGLCLSYAALVRGQMQQSGGNTSVVLQAGSAIAGKVGIDQTTPGTTNAVQVIGSLPAGSAVIGHVIVDTAPTTTVTVSGTAAATQSGTWTVQPGNTPNTTPWFVKEAPATTCGTTAVTQALAAVPTSSTAVFTSTTCLTRVFFENSNGSAQTVTLTDNAGTPLNAVGPAFSVPGLSNLLLDFGGIPFSAGIKWAAGGTGVLGGMIGYQ